MTRKDFVVRTLLVTCALGGIIDIVCADEGSYWIGTTGDWFDPANWKYEVPDGSDAYINNGGTPQITGGSPNVDHLYVGYRDGSRGYLNHTAGTLSGQVYVGYSNRTDGTFGEYNLSGTAVLVGHRICLGELGDAVFNQTGGTCRPNYLVLCESSSTATYNLSGGSGLFTLIYSYIGKSGAGRAFFNHTGSTHSAAIICLGYHGGAKATYNLSGTGRVSTQYDQIIGRRGTGTFNQTGGTNTVGMSLLLGSDDDGGGTGTYSISGGTLSAQELQVGTWGTGHFDINDASASITLSELLLFGDNSEFTAVPNSMIHMKGASFDVFDSSPSGLSGLNNLSLVFEGGPDVNCTFEVAAEDAGHAGANFYRNFALDALIIGWADVGRVQLVDRRDRVAGNEALYVKELTINDGSHLDLNGLNLYYQILIYNGGTIELNGGHLIGAPPEEVTLTVEIEPNDAAIDTVSPPAGQHTAYKNWGVDLRAESVIVCPGIYNFDHWVGDVDDPNSPSTYIVMDTDKTVTAVFLAAEPKCGDECHPILRGDLNADCYINLEDFVLYADKWMACTHPDCD